MKAHKTTLSVRELQKTIGQWKSRKITDSTIAKLLELMLGMTAYMNEDAVYPVENFSVSWDPPVVENLRC